MKAIRTPPRYILLAACLLAVSLLSGCFMQPDRTLDPLAVDALTPQPLPTAAPQLTLPPAATEAPEATPTANPQAGADNDWLDWGNLPSSTAAGQAAATARPTGTGSSWQTSATDYNAGYPVLKLGSNGSDVYDLQERLKELGYYTGPLDGKFASGTQAAVIAFQARNGLTADGIAGRATQDKLYSSSAAAAQINVPSASSASSVLKSGSQGTEVRKLQVRLAELGYYSGGADGIFGPSTEAAVKAFQRNNSLTADGAAGEQTQRRLYGSNAISASRPVATADPNATRTLRIGMEGNDVYGMQLRLIDLRYLNGVADGVFGPETEAALIAFQRNNGLTPDGVAGSGTQSRLVRNATPAAPKPAATATPRPGAYVTLREGDSGQYVYDLQERLYDLGYYNGRIDGRFGPNTTAALVTFQAANGLTADGIAGTASQTKLFSSGAKTNPALFMTPRPAAAATPIPPPLENYEVLREGSAGSAVTHLQQYLFELGYFYGRVDGRYGTDTANAVRQFQYHNSLTEDGVAGPTTQAKLYSGTAAALPESAATPRPDLTTVLREGSTGEGVRQLQTRLYQLRYLDAEYITGIFSDNTVAALMIFQQRHGLQADGVAGPLTLQTLYSMQAGVFMQGE